MVGQCLFLNYQSSKDESSRLINGRYRVGSLLGQGGIARIFMAADLLTNQEIALKIPRSDIPDSSNVVNFEFEFAMTHRHPGLVNPVGIVAHDGQPVIVMPYVPNEFPEKNNDKSPFFSSLPESEVDYVIASILETASFIHYNGYLYNDYKPANFIFSSPPGRMAGSPVHPFLLDFNLVSGLNDSQTKKGTIEYVSPEVLSGRPASFASDIYSIGVTLYELFAGRQPFVSSDGPKLIKLITENGTVDYDRIPPKYRDGIAALLNRFPEKRPCDAASAARDLGVGEIFDKLYKERLGFYLSAGTPPFSDSLLKAVAEYAGGRWEKAMILCGASDHPAEFDYITVEMSKRRWDIERVDSHYSDDVISGILDMLLARDYPDSNCRTIILVEDISRFSPSNRQKLRSLLRPSKWHPIVIASPRWQKIDLPCLVFDPASDYAPHIATLETLKRYLKSEPQYAFDALGSMTGGQPELVYHAILESANSGSFDIFTGKGEFDFQRELPHEIRGRLSAAVEVLDQPHLEILCRLAAWGDSIPLLLLSGFDNDQRDLVGSLMSSKHLRAGKDSVSFSSGYLRILAYSTLSDCLKKEYHEFWAVAAEKYLSDDETLLELSAYHWGLSNKVETGYNANLSAALDLFKKGELTRAAAYATTLLNLARAGGGSIPKALMLHADISKQAGDYPSARGKYVDLLVYLGQNANEILKAETLKDLGDLYRSQKKPGKALNYIRRARRLFEKLDNRQGVADCHNNAGLIYWVGQKFDQALISFFAALEINKSLNNFHEQANIYSNIGIIKDILGKTAEAFEFFESSHLNARKSGDPRLESRAANNLGYFYSRQNNLAKASQYFLEALQISERIGYIESVINCLTNLGVCNLKGGDLTASIDFNQRAQQMAEEIGNRHLALDSKISLADACTLMGNYSLSDKVIGSMENDPFYVENKLFACQVDLLRARLSFALENFEKGRKLAVKVKEFAASISDLHLKLEASLLEVTAISNLDNRDYLDSISDLIAEANNLGRFDIADQAAIVICQVSLRRKETGEAACRLEKILARPEQYRGLLLEAGAALGHLRFLQGRYDEAISILTENEAHSCASGFQPRALESATCLAEVYHACGKPQKAKESLSRAEAYLRQITSALAESRPQAPLHGAVVSRVIKLRNELSDKDYAVIRGGRP